MPEFFASHVPDNLQSGDLGEFCKGYFECAEWLLDTDSPVEEGGIDRSKIRGWSQSARKAMIADCRDFVRSNRELLRRYCDVTGRGMDSAGHDFYLTRERHGSGFWDRGRHDCLKALTEASRSYGEFGHVWLSRGWLRLD